MKLCHLYYGATLYGQIKTVLSAFDESTSLDINTTDSLENYDAYFIEVSDTDKNIAAKLRTLLKERLNHRPRKILNYKTPYEVFFSEMSKKLAS